MEINSYLIVGLGNPGEKYDRTRHNIGFMVVDHILEAWGRGGRFANNARIGGEVEKVERASKTLWLLKPQSFMNRSGVPVQAASRFYRVPHQNILVVCDDVNLPFGTVRIRAEGSGGGHNGLKSIQDALGGTDYPRMRLGVGGGVAGRDLSGWVLARFPESDMAKMPELLGHCAQAVEVWLSRGIEVSMSLYNKNLFAAAEKNAKKQGASE